MSDEYLTVFQECTCRNIIQVRWKTFITLQQIYSGNSVPIVLESPEFYRRYYKKQFGLFSPDTLHFLTGGA